MPLPNEFITPQLRQLEHSAKVDVDRHLYERVLYKTPYILGTRTTPVTRTSPGALQSLTFTPGLVGKNGVLHIVAFGTVAGTNGAKEVRLELVEGSGTVNNLQKLSYAAADTDDWGYDMYVAASDSELAQTRASLSYYKQTAFFGVNIALSAMNLRDTNGASSSKEALTIRTSAQTVGGGDTISSYLLIVTLYPGSA